MTSRLLIWLLCAGALVLACGPHARHNESSASTTDARPATPVPDDRALATSANVKVEHGVAFSLHVTNLADHAVELDFPSGQTHDFVVIDSLGREVWRWSDGRLFTQAFQNRLLDTKETATYEEHWDGRGRRGHFTAIALLKSSNHPVEERVSFTLP
ncbi:MAG TPA: BsuPI-related putative proteinase inhibitor [Gemmatimonadaceae bacterium]|nr:BsuPI-related putative proteinase inhibitor [Gemmatimonadaceae bacterium]